LQSGKTEMFVLGDSYVSNSEADQYRFSINDNLEANTTYQLGVGGVYGVNVVSAPTFIKLTTKAAAVDLVEPAIAVTTPGQLTTVTTPGQVTAATPPAEVVEVTQREQDASTPAEQVTATTAEQVTAKSAEKVAATQYEQVTAKPAEQVATTAMSPPATTKLSVTTASPFELSKLEEKKCSCRKYDRRVKRMQTKIVQQSQLIVDLNRQLAMYTSRRREGKKSRNRKVKSPRKLRKYQKRPVLQ